MTVDAPPSVHGFGQSLVRTSIALFVASPLALVPGVLLIADAGRLCDALAAERGTEQVVEVIGATIALAPLHLNLLSPLVVKRFLGVRARQLLPAGSILVVSGDDETWRLFARATVVTVAVLAVHALLYVGALGDTFGLQALALLLLSALWLYRLVVITVRWFRHARSLWESVAVLSRGEPGYRGPGRFFLEAVEGRREVILERVDGARVQLKYLDAARLAARSDAPARGIEIEGVKEVWRAAAPAGAKVVTAWLEES